MLWYIFRMSGEIRDFLQLPKGDPSEMSVSELALEVEGWRAVVGTMPPNILQWMARMHEQCRFTLRNYTGHAGVLVGVEFEAIKYTVYERGISFDSISGKQMLEEKEVVIPASGVAFIEFIEDANEFSRADVDRILAAESLEGDYTNHGES